MRARLRAGCLRGGQLDLSECRDFRRAVAIRGMDTEIDLKSRSPNNRLVAEQNKMAILQFMRWYGCVSRADVARAMWPHSTPEGRARWPDGDSHIYAGERRFPQQIEMILDFAFLTDAHAGGIPHDSVPPGSC
jgi:hypothetical protein